MINLNSISQDLFNKIRGRFPSITIGDETGVITNDPKAARFFEFDYTDHGRPLGKVSVNISEDNEGKVSLAVVYSNDFITTEDETVQNDWYSFLKELRVFAKKRIMNFDVRDITKSNLNKSDYQFLAQRNSGENTMTESRLYGTSNISYQNIGNARLKIKHTKPVNYESVAGRTQNVGVIYIESSEGERFKYPYKHLSGARAMARHVAEGGKPYDDFGLHITSLSEELNKLRKFKTYMGRSSVMAESLSGYMDIVRERISVVKKTIESLQKPNFYQETASNFEKTVFEDVPSDVAENWIDELTIKQFNEELADVFPYIYNLVKEGTKAKTLGPDDLDEDKDPCWKNYKMVGTKKKGGKTVPNCVPEEIQLEQGFEEMMGQFGEAEVKEAYVNTSKDAVAVLGNLRKIGKSIERGQGTYDGNLAGEYANDVYDVISWLQSNADTSDPKFKQVIGPVIELRKKAKGMEREPGSGKDARFGNEIVSTLYPLMQWIEMNGSNAQEGNAFANAVRQAKMSGKKKGDKVPGPDGDEITLEKEGKTPLGEFILSYFDRQAGQFPKGETAVLTMVEKDYGEEFIEPAKAFIEKVGQTFEQFQMQAHPQQMKTDSDYIRMRELAGLR